MLLSVDGKVGICQVVQIKQSFVDVLDVGVPVKSHSEAVFSRVLGGTKHKGNRIPVLSDLSVLHLFLNQFQLDWIVFDEFEQLGLCLSVGVQTASPLRPRSVDAS